MRPVLLGFFEELLRLGYANHNANTTSFERKKKEGSVLPAFERTNIDTINDKTRQGGQS